MRLPWTRRGLLAAAGASAAVTPDAAPAKALRFPGGKLMCPNRECGFMYDPAVGIPEQGIPPGVAFEDLPEDWRCPVCGLEKRYWI